MKKALHHSGLRAFLIIFCALLWAAPPGLARQTIGILQVDDSGNIVERAVDLTEGQILYGAANGILTAGAPPISSISGLTTALAGKGSAADTSANTAGLAGLSTTVSGLATTVSGKANLTGGKLAVSERPLMSGLYFESLAASDVDVEQWLAEFHNDFQGLNADGLAFDVSNPLFGLTVGSALASVVGDVDAVANTADTAAADIVTLQSQVSTNTGNIATQSGSISTLTGSKVDKATLTAAGDMYVATASAQPARFAVGTNGQVLRVNTGNTNKLEWATPFDATAPGAIGGGTPGAGAFTTLSSNAAGVASTPPVVVSGAWFASGGTGTTTMPQVLIRPTGTTAATTWSTAGTGLGWNAPSGFTGNFWDCHVGGGASVAKVSSDGSFTTSGDLTATGAVSIGSSQKIIFTGSTRVFAPSNGSLSIRTASDTAATSIIMGPSGSVSWTVGSGSPEGVVTAPVGSFYSRTNGGAATSWYVKETGTGNTGWTAK